MNVYLYVCVYTVHIYIYVYMWVCVSNRFFFAKPENIPLPRSPQITPEDFQMKQGCLTKGLWKKRVSARVFLLCSCDEPTTSSSVDKTSAFSSHQKEGNDEQHEFAGIIRL